MEITQLMGIGIRASRIAPGTLAIGGWKWEGIDDEKSIRTIHTALDQGITVLDTVPVYWFGRSEEIIGKAIAVAAAGTGSSTPPRSSGVAGRTGPSRSIPTIMGRNGNG